MKGTHQDVHFPLLSWRQGCLLYYWPWVVNGVKSQNCLILLFVFFLKCYTVVMCHSNTSPNPVLLKNGLSFPSLPQASQTCSLSLTNKLTKWDQKTEDSRSTFLPCWNTLTSDFKILSTVNVRMKETEKIRENVNFMCWLWWYDQWDVSNNIDHSLHL